MFQAELRKSAVVWNDPPSDPAWSQPDPALVVRIESALGLVADRFAFSQTMPLAEFREAADALGQSGYRPVRFRPYADGSLVRVAAVWVRDGRHWRMASGLSPEQTRQQDDKNRSGKFLPVNMAGYVTTGADDNPIDRYAALWVEKSGEDEARMYVGASYDDHKPAQDRLKAEKLIPRTLHALRGADGGTRYSGVWGRSPAADPSWSCSWDYTEASFEQKWSNESQRSLIDLAVSAPQLPRDLAQSSLGIAEKSLKAKPDDLKARLDRATALIRLGDDRKALDDLVAVCEKAPAKSMPFQYRAIVHARLGRKKEALDELAEFQKRAAATNAAKLYLAIVVAAELGEGQNAAFERLESVLKKEPHNPGLFYDAACAYSLASRAVAGKDQPSAESMARERSPCSEKRSGTGTPTINILRTTWISTRSETIPRSAR